MAALDSRVTKPTSLDDTDTSPFGRFPKKEGLKLIWASTRDEPSIGEIPSAGLVTQTTHDLSQSAQNNLIAANQAALASAQTDLDLAEASLAALQATDNATQQELDDAIAARATALAAHETAQAAVNAAQDARGLIADEVDRDRNLLGTKGVIRIVVDPAGSFVEAVTSMGEHISA